MRSKRVESLSEEQIDEIVIAQAENDTAWEKPIQVQRIAPITMPVPPDLASRAAFFARLHQELSAEDWLRRIIQERIDFEEAAFAELKRAIAAKSNV